MIIIYRNRWVVWTLVIFVCFAILAVGAFKIYVIRANLDVIVSEQNYSETLMKKVMERQAGKLPHAASQD